MINMQTWRANEEIESGYFGEMPETNPLVRLWLIKAPEKEPSGIAKSFSRQQSEKEEASLLSLVPNPITAGKDLLVDVFEWGKTLVWDIQKISKWKIQETEGLLWDVIKSGWKNVWRIKEFNALVDETGGNVAQKITFAGLSTVWSGFEILWEWFMSALKTIASEELEADAKEYMTELADTNIWKSIINAVKEWGEKLDAFEQSSPQAKALSMATKATLWVWLEAVWVGTVKRVGVKAWEEIIDIADKAWDAISDTIPKIKDSIPELPSFSRKVTDEIPEEMRTVRGKIWDIEVEIPEVNRSISEKVVSPFTQNTTNKTLAGKAVSPRTIWKNRKWKLASISEVENRTRNFYNNIRTGQLDWDISTLESAAQTMVNNLDTVGARIWNAVKKVDGSIVFDNKITDSIVDALESKWSKVSPATSILKNFFDELWDGNLTIKEAYAMKKSYSNEVSKLVRAWDAGTDQYKALSDWVNFLNTKIDEIIDTQLWSQFAGDKTLYRDLLWLADDMVASSLVDGRRSANTFAERMGMLESISSPIASTVSTVRRKLTEANESIQTRGGAWVELIKRYDEEAIKNLDIK